MAGRDPLARHIWREGSPTGEILDAELAWKIEVGVADPVLTLPGWQTIRLRLEDGGLTFADDWYRARLIGLGLQALEGEGESGKRGLANFGYYFRDWQARRGFGRKAKSKLRIEGNTSRQKNPAVAAANLEQRNRALARKRSAQKIAAAMWRAKPTATAAELAPRVRVELVKLLDEMNLPDDEMETEKKKLPAVGTIRKALSRLRPKA